MEWTEITSILNDSILKAQKLNQKEIRFYENDFKHIISVWNDLPPSIFTILELATINGEEMLCMNTAGGKTATSILSRFSNGNVEINKLTEEIVTHEKTKNKDKILAEIVHVPSVKVANVLCRPKMRDYEIPYLGKSSVKQDKQIPISDLTISVLDDKIIIKSIKLDKEIIPILSCAHDYSNSSLAIYQFLCDAGQAEKTSKIGFSWGSLVSVYRYLPRVLYENVIVSKARWIFNNKDIFYKFNDEKMLFQKIKKWKEEHNVPSIINLIDGENYLTINLSNKNSIEIFFDEIKNKKWFSIEEVLSCGDTPIRDEKNNFYANEFVVSIGLE